MRRTLVTMATGLLVGAMLVSSAVTASAAKGGPAGGSSSSLSLVLLNSTDGLPHYGQSVTFNVSTSATQYPTVGLSCYQGGALVMSWNAGFYPSYPWSRDAVLSSPSWTSGGASCTATLYYGSGKKTVTLATLNFQVYS